jgi:pimeloyl-ACP methyl ester carboxylesterase
MVNPTRSVEDHGIAPDDLGLENDYAGSRDLPVETVVSADGTPIAYELSGSGPPVVVIGGGLNDRAMFYPFSNLMSQNFTVYNCDRRGRGDSGYGNPDTYTIYREVEDLAAVADAVINATGERPSVFANCTGGQIALLAAAQGVPIKKLGLYEPPYWSRPAKPEELDHLQRLIAEDRREEVVSFFGLRIVGFLTEDTLEGFKQHPAWKAFEANSPSTYYDAIISKDHTEIPYEELRKITVPTFLIRGDSTSEGIFEACAKVVAEMPDARLLTMEGAGHVYDQKRVAPLMTEFFQE